MEFVFSKRGITSCQQSYCEDHEGAEEQTVVQLFAGGRLLDQPASGLNSRAYHPVMGLPLLFGQVKKRRD
jgi:hypothetical protein